MTDRALEVLREWKHNVPKFCWDNFRVHLEPWQVRGADAYNVPGKKRVAAQAAVGVGKSAWKAMMAWHFLATNGDQRRHPGKFPNGYALSISAENLRSGLWKELGVWRERSEFLKAEFEYSAESITHRQFPGLWWLRFRSYAKSADPEVQGAALSGLHSPWSLVLLDEVGEMHPAIGRRAEQVLSDSQCEVGTILASGNPTSTSGLLYDIATTGAGWTVIRITGDPDDPDCSARVDKAWAREQIAKYGRDNPWVMAHILGLFPPTGLNTLLTPDEVRTAMARNPDPDTYAWAQKRMGIDVARFGDDRTVIFPRQGAVAYQPITLRQQRTDFITARVLQAKRSFESEVDFIDDTGHWGHGVVDGLLAAQQGAQAVMFSDPATDPRYGNRRAEMWFRLADWIKLHGALPNIPELIPELTQPMYFFAPSGKLMLESKEQIKKRLGRSPDLADALALTFAWPDTPGVRSLTGVTQSATVRRAVTDYNPLRDLDSV